MTIGGRPTRRARPKDPALEALNFTNLVHHYREELGQVSNGTLASEVLDKCDIKHLRDRGILTPGVKTKNSVVAWSVEVLMDRLKA